MRTDFYPIPRMDSGRRTFMRFSTSILLLLFIWGTPTSTSAQHSCIRQVNVSLDGSGEARIFPSMFSRSSTAGWTVEIMSPSVSDPTLVDCSLVGREVMVRVIDTSGNVCMSQLNVEDKSLFEVQVRDTLIGCYVPLDSLSDLIVRLSDNCDDIDAIQVSYTDVQVFFNNHSADTLAHFIRAWSFTNAKGETQRAISNIYLSGIDTALIMLPQDTMIFCPADPEDIALSGEPTYQGIPLSQAQMSCRLQLSTTITRDVPFKFCNDKIGYTRRWFLIDPNNRYNSMIWMGTQSITYEDTFTNRLVVPITPIVDIGNCQYQIEVQRADTNTIGCTNIPDELLEVYVNDVLRAPGDLLVFNYGDTAIIRYDGIDDCWDELVEVYDTIIYTGTDTFTIACPPAMSLINVSVDPGINKTIWVDALLSPTVLSCGRMDTFSVVARRMVPSACDLDTTYKKILSFCDADIGQVIMIQVAVMNAQGELSSNVCMMQIQVKASAATTNVICPNDMIISIDTALGDAALSPNDLLAQMSFSNGVRRLIGRGSINGTYNFDFTSVYTGGMIDTLYGGHINNTNLVEEDFLVFTCTDTGRYDMVLTLLDTIGLTGTCAFDISITDPLSACDTASPLISMSVMAYDKMPLAEVNVVVDDSGVKKDLKTDQYGKLLYTPDGESIAVSLYYQASRRSGLTAHDVYLLRQYIMGNLDNVSTYHHYIADIDQSGTVDLNDLMKLQKMLVSDDISVNEASNEEWLFIDPAKDWHEDSYIVRSGGSLSLHGAKIGDMDGSSLKNIKVRSNEYSLLPIEISHDIEKGDWQRLKIDISKLEDRISALQLGLLIPHVEDVRTQTENVVVAIVNGELRMIADHIDNVETIELLLKSKSELSGHDVSINTASPLSPWSFVDGRHREVKIVPIASGQEKMRLTLYPNPSSGAAHIYPASVPESGVATLRLTVINAMGQVAYQYSTVERTESLFPIQIPESLATGLYLISCDINDEIQHFKYYKE